MTGSLFQVITPYFQQRKRDVVGMNALESNLASKWSTVVVVGGGTW